MRLCLIGDGTEMHLRRWAREFVSRQHEVHLLTYNAETNVSAVELQKVKVHVIKKPSDRASMLSRAVNLLPVVYSMYSTVKSIRPDLVHVHSAGAYAWLATLCNFRPRMISPWGSDVLEHVNESKVLRLLTSVSLRKADLVHCDGYNTRKALISLGVSQDKIKLCMFGTDVGKFSPGQPDPSFMSRFGIAGTLNVISTRTHSTVHNVETFVRAMPLVKAQCPNVRFLVGGDGPLRGELEALAASLGVQDSAVFLGRLSEADVSSALRAANVYVSTTLSESGLAASTAEAMATGLPVVSTEVGDIKEWLTDGEGGFIVPCRSPEALADRIVLLLNNDMLRRSAARLNRSVIEQRNNIKLEMDKINGLYTDLASA